MTESPFRFEVWTPTLSERVWVPDPTALVFTARHNAQPTGTLTLPSDHKRTRRLNVDGCRYRCWYEDEYVSSGQVRAVKKSGIGNDGEYDYTLVDDWRLFTRLLALPVPAQAANNQGAAEYDVRTGPAESVVNGLLTANLARLAGVGLPVTVAASAGRGATMNVQARWHRIADRVLPAMDLAGIGYTVRQVGAGLTVAAYEPVTWPIRMSEDAGTIIASTWTRSLPEVTRVYVGAGGEGTARVFRGPFVNTAAETALHDWVEDFVDARDIDPADVNLTALIAGRAAEALGAGSYKAGLSVDLAETPNYRYGGPTGVHVGDRVPFVLGTYDEQTENADVDVLIDVLRSATLSMTPDQGVTVEPTIGDRTDDPDELLYAAVGADARRHRLKAGE